MVDGNHIVGHRWQLVLLLSDGSDEYHAGTADLLSVCDEAQGQEVDDKTVRMCSITYEYITNTTLHTKYDPNNRHPRAEYHKVTS